MPASRRDFLQTASFGLAVAGVPGFLLRADAHATPRALDADEAETILAELGPAPKAQIVSDAALAATRPNPLGPFFRAGAPFRAKVSPPHAEGVTMIVSGRVWAIDTRRPLAGTVLDVWQVDNATRKYSAGGGEGGENGDYAHRARVVCSETGYYEFETVHPVWYAPNPGDPSFVRSPHIHFIATRPGYQRLVSEMFFEGDEKHDEDTMFHPLLAVKVEQREARGRPVHHAVFDIVLEPEGR